MDDNPISQLLSEHKNETTVIDQHFKNYIAPKIEKNNTNLQHKDNSNTKPKESDKDEEDNNDQPIGLVHRQPSFSSLHGNLIGKDGVQVDRLPDIIEEGKEVNRYHQDSESKESKPNKPSKKSKNTINQINSFSSQDNVIAFDEHDDSEDVPIGLTYRQPSFSSMGDHLISKGGDSLADMVPLKTIPIEDAIIEEENDDNTQKKTEEEEAENEEDEENPQVQIVKDLSQRNKERWIKMGYEPPPNLIQLTRAQSQSVFNQNQVFKQPPTTMSPLLFSPVQEEDENPILNHNNNRNITSNQKSTDKSIKNSNSQLESTTNKPKIAHRRCGSNGMKLGEASTSLARMSQALMICDSNTKMQNANDSDGYEEEEDSLENQLEEEEEVEPSQNNIEKENSKKDNKHSERKHKDMKNLKEHSKQFDESQSNSYAFRGFNEKKASYLLPSSTSSSDSDSDDNDYYYYHGNDELFGNLGQIVKEDQSSDVYKIILSGRLPRSNKDNYSIKRRIQQYINTCINNLWIDETEYLSKILEGSHKHFHNQKPTEPKDYHQFSHHRHHFSNHHYHIKPKNLSLVERLKIKARDEDETFEIKIQETLLKQKHMLEMLNEEYKEAANDLDARYLIHTSANRNDENEFNSDWSVSPAVLELKTAIRRLMRAKKYGAVNELSAKLKQLEMEEACEVSEMIHEHYVNTDRLLKERFAIRRALLISKIQYELKVLNEERQNTARRYSSSISRLKSMDLEIKNFYNFPENDGDAEYDDYSSDNETNTFPQRLSRENDEKIIQLMSEKLMNLESSHSDIDDYDDYSEKHKKKKKSKKNKDKKKDKKKKDKKKDRKKEKK